MEKKWALILGASSGFGGATAVELAKNGYNILGMHLDRQATMPVTQQVIKKIERAGQKAIFFNINAADQYRIHDTLDEIKEKFTTKDQPQINVLLHSLAFGALKPYIAKNPNDCLSSSQMSMTLDVMAHSLVYWTQGLVQRDLLARGGRIFCINKCRISYGDSKLWSRFLQLKLHWKLTSVSLQLKLGPMKNNMQFNNGRCY